MILSRCFSRGCPHSRIICGTTNLLHAKDGIVDLFEYLSALRFALKNTKRNAHHDTINTIIFIGLNNSLLDALSITQPLVQRTPHLLQHKLHPEIITLFPCKLGIEFAWCGSCTQDPDQFRFLGPLSEGRLDFGTKGGGDGVRLEEETFACVVCRHFIGVNLKKDWTRIEELRLSESEKPETFQSIVFLIRSRVNYTPRGGYVCTKGARCLQAEVLYITRGYYEQLANDSASSEWKWHQKYERETRDENQVQKLRNRPNRIKIWYTTQRSQTRPWLVTESQYTTQSAETTIAACVHPSQTESTEFLPSFPPQIK